MSNDMKEVTLKHGDLEIIVRGPSEVIDALGKVEVSSYPEEGRPSVAKLVSAIGGIFRRDRHDATRWHEAVRPHHKDTVEAPRPHFDITVYE